MPPATPPRPERRPPPSPPAPPLPKPKDENDDVDYGDGEAEDEKLDTEELPAEDVASATSLKKEEEDPASDSEDERNQCAEILKNMDALVVAETKKEEEKVESASATATFTRLELLLRIRRLMQLHVSGEAPASDELEIVGQKKTKDADQQTEDETAQSLKITKLEETTDEKAKEEEEERGETYDAAELLVPQARKFMAERGFGSFDEIKDGQTLVHHCCQESAKRMAKIRCSNIETVDDHVTFNRIT